MFKDFGEEHSDDGLNDEPRKSPSKVSDLVKKMTGMTSPSADSSVDDTWTTKTGKNLLVTDKAPNVDELSIVPAKESSPAVKEISDFESGKVKGQEENCLKRR